MFITPQRSLENPLAVTPYSFLSQNLGTTNLSVFIGVLILDISYRWNYTVCVLLWDFPGAPVVKNLPANEGDIGDTFDPWVRKIPWGRK